MEQLKGAEAKVKILGGAIKKSKGLFFKKNVIDICTMIEVWTTYRSTR
jgi:hypothetical protein